MNIDYIIKLLSIIVLIGAGIVLYYLVFNIGKDIKEMKRKDDEK